MVKVLDLAVARMGLRDPEAREAGFDSLTVEVEEWDHKVYYPGAHRLRIRVTGDRRSGRLLGAQIVGDHRGQVAKRIDVFAAALYTGLGVADLGEWFGVKAAADATSAAQAFYVTWAILIFLAFIPTLRLPVIYPLIFGSPQMTVGSSAGPDM